MLRQCAWCLRLIDVNGARLSPSPLPKLYDASHGMCEVCGKHAMQQVLEEASVKTACYQQGAQLLAQLQPVH